jgi:hypothetical protein
MPPQAVIQQDLSKGSNVAASPYVLGKQQSVLITNMILDEHGSLDVRDGTVLQTSSPDAPANARPIVKLFDFVRQDGTIFPLAVVRGTAGNNQLYRRDTTPWTLIGTLGTQYAIPDLLTFTNLALIVNGDETPRSFDGAVLAVLTSSTGTVPGGGRHHTLHQGYYWLWGTGPVTTTLDGPSSLRSTDLNNTGSWPAANQVFVDKDSGEAAAGLGQFTIAESGISPSTSQILFKTFSAYQMTGVFGSTTPAFAIQRIKSDMGCVAARTIKFAPGFGLLRLTHRGVALYDGVDDRLVSEEVRPLFFGSEIYSGIDWTNADKAYAEVIPNPPLYVLFCPTSAAGLVRVFCYDLVRRAWTMLQYPNAVSCVQMIADPGTQPMVMIGEFATGAVRAIFNPAATAAATDDGAAIPWSIYARPVPGASPQQRAYFRRTILKVFNAAAQQVISWSALFGPIVSATPVQLAGTLTVPAAVPPTIAAGGGYGTEPYGLLPWGDLVPSSEVDLTIDHGIIATNLRLLISGFGRLKIRGLETHVKPKPLTRPSVYA